jgi:carboxypeptidase family protein
MSSHPFAISLAVVVQAFPPSLRYSEARRSAQRGGGRPAVSGRPKGLHYARAGIFSCCLAFAATAAAQAPPPPPSPGTAIISGRIFAADTGKPLRRARIVLSSLDLGGPPRTANTNVDGRFEFKDLPEGRYTASASRGGYLQIRYGQRRPLEPTKPLEVRAGQTIERVDFTLPRTGLITGHITDEIGDPAAGITVFAMRTEYWRGRRQLVTSGPPGRTDDSGQYRVVGLSPGTYFLRTLSRETWSVTRAGKKEIMSFATTYFPGTPDLKQARSVTVGIAQQASGVDFSLVPARTVTVSGTVFDSHGRPISNVGLVQQVGGPNGGIVGMVGNAVTAADGTFVIRNVAPGEYTLKAAGSDEVTTLPIVVGGADIENVSLVTSAGWSASGTVTTERGTPPAIARERVRISVNSTLDPTNMGMQGEPRPRQVLNDDWTFSATAIVGPARFRVALPPGWALKSILHNGRDVTDTAIEMKSGEELSGIQVVVTDRVTTLAGQLLDEKGVPIADGTVIVFAGGPEKWSDESRYVRAVRPDHQGQFQINGLPAGDYLAVALDYVQDGMWNDPEYLASIRRDAQKLTLNEGGSRVISLKLMVP